MTDATALAAQLAALDTEARDLELPRFDESVAWRIGCHIQREAAARALPIAIEVSKGGQRLFFCAMPGSSPDNAAWIHRKRSMVERFLVSSLVMKLRADLDGRPLLDRYQLSRDDYVSSGGGFALRARGCGCVGAVVVSGLTQFEDHALAADAVRAERERQGASHPD